MSGNNGDFRPRPGPAPKLIEGPRVGQRSLYRQQVLDEDSYTDALSHIITRDFFPNLPHIHATNAYLSALTSENPELLSSSIRRLAQLAQEKEDGARGSRQNGPSSSAASLAAEEFRNMRTPHISLPGRTPIGARGWDTPRMSESGRRRRGGSVDSQLHGPDGESSTGRPAGNGGGGGGKKRRIEPVNRIRDDLSLDAFQRNYTSEDNASFVQIVAQENKQKKEERWGWAWAAQAKAEQRKIEWEEKRKEILDTAISGNWRVDANGRRMIGGLAQGGSEEGEGRAWVGDKPRLMLAAAEANRSGNSADAGETVGGEGETGNSGTLVKHASSTTSSALVKTSGTGASSSKADETLDEVVLPEHHPLGRALAEAGLPTTALVSKEDGVLVPMRETTSGYGDGRGRGQEEADRRKAMEKAVMGNEERSHLALGGSGAEGWGFKTRNNFYFPADADEDPYPKPNRPVASSSSKVPAPVQPSISYANTRLHDTDEVSPAFGHPAGGDSRSRSSSLRGTSPARSWVDAAVRGTPYVPRNGRPEDPDMPSVGDYPLLPADPSPTPESLPSLLTWGTLMSTPRALDASDDPLDSTPSFKLPNTKRRDEIGRRLGDKASRAMHERAKGFTPRPRSSAGGNGGGLSDALRAAAERSKGRTPARSGGGPGGSMAPPGMTPKRSDLSSAGQKLLERSLGRTPGHSGALGGLGEVKRSWGMSGQSSRPTADRGWTPK